MSENQAAVKPARRGLLKPSTRENLRIYWYNFRRNPLSIIGLIIVLICLYLALFPQTVTHFHEHVGEFVNFKDANQAPNSVYWFGTDVNGRDVYTRVIYSFRGAMLMSVVVLGVSVPIGVALGLIAGYNHGKWIDTLIMRITDVFLAMPPLILCLSIASMLEYNMINSMLAITIMWWPWYTRMVYSATVGIAEEYFVKEAELIGASKAYIIFREILPNCISPILTKMALDVGWVILQGASLSFVGLGEQPPKPSFGTMISDGSKFMPAQWWTTIMPAIGIVFMILGFNFFGDGIRDMFDRGKQS